MRHVIPLSAWVSVAEKVPLGLRQSSNIRPSMMPRAITASLCSADDRALTTTDLGAQAICCAWALAIGPATAINWWWLGVFVLLQLGRLWVLASLGEYWTTRIITVPGVPLVQTGPYRWLRHPNYLVVVVEIATLRARR